ncbi:MULTISPECIES: HesB/YadR/YfhF family protein [Paenibacillus]|nr:HesB-like protein [Paenibacillus sp. oral taxon 786 str. D14]
MIHVSSEAAAWFKKELGLQEGQAVRFFARYSAGGKLHPGFSLGIDVDQPVSPGIKSEVEGITFYMEDQDLWYLDGYHLNVTYDPQLGDIEYEYEVAAPN